MSTNNPCNTTVETTKCCRNNIGFVIIIVLYILLSIIIGSCLY